jgi:hypothetical protein
MEYQNLSKNTIDISLYYKLIDEKIFKDSTFIELMGIVSDKNQYQNIQYTLYTDSFLLRKNIFIPNFHTIYLSNNKHNVVINDPEDCWLLNVFPNNKYYYLNSLTIHPPTDTRITRISTLKDIIGNIK